MNISVKLNPKHESFMVTAFHEMLANSGHQISLVYEHSDLKDPEAEPSLENLGVQTYMLRLVDSVVYTDAKGKHKVLHQKTLFLTK